jgi:hypothetical protein
VAILGSMSWTNMTILPGLVASGGALLFGVNAWCLDGRGLLWRENLPARPEQVFAARAIVLAEFVLVASLVTLVMASLRAGEPTPSELSAMVMLVLVVTVQVLAAAMRWSAQRPFPVDMRSARATPAPPVVMVGYSARLALSTTFTGLFFSTLARFADWRIPLLLAVPLLAWSGYRLWRAARSWQNPTDRSRVVMAVAALVRGESPADRGFLHLMGIAMADKCRERLTSAPLLCPAWTSRPPRGQPISANACGPSWPRR